jgi:hypothetical protein
VQLTPRELAEILRAFVVIDFPAVSVLWIRRQFSREYSSSGGKNTKWQSDKESSFVGSGQAAKGF